MNLKRLGIATLLLSACQAPLTSPPVTKAAVGPSQAETPRERAPEALVLVQTAPAAAASVPPSIASDVGPKSTGPSTQGVQDIVNFFRTLNLSPGQSAPSLTAQALLAQIGVRSVKAVRFSLVATLANTEKSELFSAVLDSKGAYTYTAADLASIQQKLEQLGEIALIECVFYGPPAQTASAPLARVTPRLSKRNTDDYVLECDIPEEDDNDDFYEDESEDEEESEDDNEEDSASSEEEDASSEEDAPDDEDSADAQDDEADAQDDEDKPDDRQEDDDTEERD